jgi:hypothetical protein
MNQKTFSRKGLIVLFSALAIVGASGSVLAGQKTESNVTVTATTGFGSVGTARSSADANQFIQCQITGTTGSNSVSCAARDAAGTYLTCTGNANATYLAAAVAGIGPNSRIYFAVNAGVCTQITSSNGSQYKPVVP